MKRIGLVLALSFAAACAKESADTRKKIEELEARVDNLGGRLQRIEQLLQGLQGQGQQPPEPDPKAVYAVPIEGAPYKGPEHAKVTIVEAYEFA